MAYQFCGLLPYLIGYCFAIFVGHLYVGKISKVMYADIGLKERKVVWHSKILGLIERILFLFVLQVGHPEFIAIWLGLKTAGGWVHWQKEEWYLKEDDGTFKRDEEGNPKRVIGRNVFNVFLVGQALTIAFAAISWKIIDWFNGCIWCACTIGVHKCINEILGLILIFLAINVLLLYVCIKSKKNNSTLKEKT